MNRRNFVKSTFALGVSSFITINTLEAWGLGAMPDSPFTDDIIDKNEIVPAPDNASEWPAWREGLENWKKKKHSELNYDGSTYRSGDFDWVRSSFACCFMMMYDSEFYDHAKEEYNIDYLISEGTKRYGGYDSIVLWHAYPRIGIDKRNQFDFYREMPQGLTGLNKVVKVFHQNNIKVFINYNPWDTGTRREQQPDIEGLIEIIRSIDADGIFLDTMKNAPDFREKLNNVKPGLVMEGEAELPLEHIKSHHMSWAQGFKDSPAPGVYRNKWFEPMHMQHAIDRWENDKTIHLQTAWMNGSGIMIWENIFGQWLGWNERDKWIYRTIFPIQHHFRDLFSRGHWTPLSQKSPVEGVYISLWEDEDTRLWTLVNRNEFPVEGVLMSSIKVINQSLFDLVKGEEITGENDQVNLSGNICQRGVGCFLSILKAKIDSKFMSFLVKQKENFKSASVDTTIPLKNNQLAVVNPTRKYSAPLKGMVELAPASLTFNLEYTLNEIGSYGNAQEHLAISEKNKQFLPYQFTRNAEIQKMAVDETPVTNAMFKEFLIRSGHRPKISENFLKHWINGQIPKGREDHPVVYVDLNDARAYSRWAGKRLLTEFEWQYAAQGPDALAYPWGNEMEENKCNQNTNGETTPVKAYREGISPFGCYDMCGNTWEWTESEYSDTRTRFVMLKGGSCYKAKGSYWYTNGGPQKNNFLAKMLLLWPGLDRCATIGFRCAIDM